MSLTEYFTTIFVLFYAISLVEINGAAVQLVPIKCRGLYLAANKENLPSIFLSRARLEVFSTDDENDMILCDILPIQLPTNNIRDLIYKAFSPSTYSLLDTRVGCSVLLNRDKGIFDHLPYDNWFKGLNIRREFYNYLSGGQGTNADGLTYKFNALPEAHRNPHLAFTFAMNLILGLDITGLLLEVLDETSSGVQIGAAAVVTKSKLVSEWTLSTNNIRLPPSDSRDAIVVSCHLDEAVGFALCSGMPIFASSKLFDRLALDGALRSERKGSSIYLSITATAATSSQKILESSVEPVKPAWEIFNPQTFLTMSTKDKRATLRASGATNIPRPRDGNSALDAALLDLADDAVRREVIRLRGLLSGEANETVKQGMTRTQMLLRDMEIALQSGDMPLAEKLREEFAKLTLLRADSTQAAGSYDPYLDQDEWYLEARRRAMAPKK